MPTADATLLPPAFPLARLPRARRARIGATPRRRRRARGPRRDDRAEAPRESAELRRDRSSARERAHEERTSDTTTVKARSRVSRAATDALRSVPEGALSASAPQARARLGRGLAQGPAPQVSEGRRPVHESHRGCRRDPLTSWIRRARRRGRRLSRRARGLRRNPRASRENSVAPSPISFVTSAKRTSRCPGRIASVSTSSTSPRSRGRRRRSRSRTRSTTSSRSSSARASFGDPWAMFKRGRDVQVGRFRDLLGARARCPSIR